HLLQQLRGPVDAGVPRIAGERPPLQRLLDPGEPAARVVDAQAARLRTFLADLDDRPAAVGGAKRGAFAVRADLCVAGARRAEPVDRQLREATARELERDVVNRVGVAVVVARGVAREDGLRKLAEVP